MGRWDGLSEVPTSDKPGIGRISVAINLSVRIGDKIKRLLPLEAVCGISLLPSFESGQERALNQIN